MSWLARPGSAHEESRPGALRLPSVADEFLESYVCWREACEDVGSSYECWGRSTAPDRDLAFETYRAALDREGHAAHVHAVWAGRLQALER
jgi:hypothetical protein